MDNPFKAGTDEHAAWQRQTSLEATHATFARWLGESYDLGALDAVLCVAAAERLGGDPAWLMVVSGSGNAKTETVQALAGMGAHVTSTIASEGALLSATSSKDKARDATGGLLRKIGSAGVLVIKDFTSVLSMNRDIRAQVLAALREVYDGRWERNVGTDGGRTLTWTGRIVVIGAVTSAYDSAHAVIAAMGDRFALVRVDSSTGRIAAGVQALHNVDRETEMRGELAGAVRDLIGNLDPDRAILDRGDYAVLLAAADLVTLARTAVERDYRGDVIDAHAPEMPTRFAKFLGQVVRGGLALGMSREHAHAVALRVAGDSVPPLRLAILGDVAAHPYSRTSEVQKRLQRPRSTVDRELQALHLLGLLFLDDEHDRGWRYVLSDTVNQQAIEALITRKVSTGGYGDRREVHLVTDISGNASAENLRETDTTPTTAAALWRELDGVGPLGMPGACFLCGRPTEDAVCKDCDKPPYDQEEDHQ
jgi:hypothetical protein